MLAIAMLVPETVLLVPGASGATSILAEEREAALTLVTSVLEADASRVVVVSAGRVGRSGTHLSGPVRPSLTAVGIDDAQLGWAPRVLGTRPGERGEPGDVTTVLDAGAAVALLLLGQVGWAGGVEVHVVLPDDANALQRLGAELTEGEDRVALVLVGSLSARRGPDGPAAQDERAAGFDEAVLADLSALGGAAGGAASDRLAAVPASVARELAVSAWGPWQVLLGAMGSRRDGGFEAELRLVSAPFGATYVCLGWDAARAAA